MNVECPPRFLLAELQILRPRVLIVFGGAAREGVLSALRTIDKAEPNWSHPTRSGYGRRESQVSWGPLDVLGMWHPTYARWPHALTALIDDLTARPLDRTRRA
jgi:uracil-DNA glycosylase